jgi:carbamoyl-phosphate synthase large subunit
VNHKDSDAQRADGRAKHRVLVAGIAGASLGTEIAKCLQLAGRYEVFGCDILATAYGIGDPLFADTAVVRSERYIDDVIDICLKWGVVAVIPGGERPASMLSAHRELFETEGISIIQSDSRTVGLASDKSAFFAKLESLGIEVPFTKAVRSRDDPVLRCVPLPAVVKPSTDSGGSQSVYVAETRFELVCLAQMLLDQGRSVTVQEYLPHDEGEYTIGVLRFHGQETCYSIAIRRIFDSRLSVAFRSSNALISSGFTQGQIEAFTDVRAAAQQIVERLDSFGPINVQGRVVGGRFFPFEVNARFSASTYLRTLAGFNEVDMYLSYVLDGTTPNPPSIRYGYYLRTFSEKYVPSDMRDQ